MPDLTSLTEYNRLHGTAFTELSFQKLTIVYQKCPSLKPLVEPLVPYLGRSHFLRFQAGGFFPYHRDAYGDHAKTFRIFVPLHRHSSRDFVFLLGRERIEMEKGRPYFINTCMEHALFVLDEPSTHLVLNVKICPEAVGAVWKMLHSY